ncbi:hypothetical protein XENOCAPTIV_016257, partial [Xenoophorus captivus]
ELRRMQEQMQKLQRQLEASQKNLAPPSTKTSSAGSSTCPKPGISKPTPTQPPASKLSQARPKQQAGKRVVHQLTLWYGMIMHQKTFLKQHFRAGFRDFL